MGQSFYCSRCGVNLQAEDVSHVVCPHCDVTVETPLGRDRLRAVSLALPEGLRTVEGSDAPEDALSQLAAAAERMGVVPRAASVLLQDHNLLQAPNARRGPFPPVLGYAHVRPRRKGLDWATLQAMADRLEQVEAGELPENNDMSSCPHCDSRIASFVGRCPFCRHPLRGG